MFGRSKRISVWLATALLACAGAAAASVRDASEGRMATPVPAVAWAVYDESPLLGRRAQPALLIGERVAHETEYLVLLRSDLERAGPPRAVAGLAGREQRVSAVLAEVVEEAIGFGARVHHLEEGPSSAFVASMDLRALDWVLHHPAVDVIEALDARQFAALVDRPVLGGLEQTEAEDPGRSVWTSNRILINGSILGWGLSGYRQPFISPAGNLMGHAAEILRRLDYTVSWNAATQTLTAVRDGSRNLAGAREIRLRHNSRDLQLIPAGGGPLLTVPLPENARVDNGVMLAPVRVLLITAGVAIIDWDEDTRSLQAYYYEELDVGIYFLGVQQNAVRNEQPGTQRFIPGQPNPFFNPARPTILYAHGWQRDNVVNRRREGLLLTEDRQWQNVQNYWLTRGWNVGIFQWVQLADDDWGAEPRDTEGKIYNANRPGVGMRWKRSDGAFSTRGNPTLNVTQLYRQHYLQVANALNPGVEIRLIGNSLGANLSLNMVRELIINGSRLPTRVTLHDPYWNPNFNPGSLPAGFGNTRALAADAARRASNAGLALEYFRTSLAGRHGYAIDVARIASFVQFRPEFTNNHAIKHTQPVRIYFWAFDFAGTIASPRTPHATVRQRMNTENFWDHTAGTRTATPGDDGFVTRSPKPNPD